MDYAIAHHNRRAGTVHGLHGGHGAHHTVCIHMHTAGRLECIPGTIRHASMSEGQRWNQQNGMLWMEKGGLRLVIHLPSTEGYVRFVVIDHRGPHHRPDRLIGSGTLEDVGTAKRAAERMAERFVTAPRHQT